jgi:periplasmic divalent cation tolerance protein
MHGDPDEACVILTTSGSLDEAEKIADSLLRKRQAACVSVFPKGRSLYRWKGKIEQADEHLIVIKTKRNVASAAIGSIKEKHSYEVPEILCLPVVDGDQDYLDWIRTEVEGNGVEGG